MEAFSPSSHRYSCFLTFFACEIVVGSQFETVTRRDCFGSDSNFLVESHCLEGEMWGTQRGSFLSWVESSMKMGYAQVVGSVWHPLPGLHPCSPPGGQHLEDFRSKRHQDSSRGWGPPFLKF